MIARAAWSSGAFPLERATSALRSEPLALMANETVTLPLIPTDLGLLRARAPYTLAA